MKKRAIIWCSSIAIVLSLILFANWYYTQKLWKRITIELVASAVKNQSLLLDDLKIVQDAKIFPENQYKSDASDFLYEKFVTNKQQAEKLDILAEKLKNGYKLWSKESHILSQLSQDRDFLNYDCSWIEKIQNFDHWSRFNRPDIAKVVSGFSKLNGIEKIDKFSQLPVDNYNYLHAASLCYLAKKSKLSVEEKIQGMKLYRKATELIQSSEDLISQMIAVRILRSEEPISRYLNIQDTWVPISEATLAAHKRAFWAWSGILYPSGYWEIPEAFKPYMSSNTGFCSAVAQTALQWSGFQDYFVPNFLFEPSFKPVAKKSYQLSTEHFKICHLTALMPAISRSPASSLKAANDEKMPLQKIPFVRRYIGLNLMAIATPNYFKIYSNKESTD